MPWYLRDVKAFPSPTLNPSNTNHAENALRNQRARVDSAGRMA